MKRDELALEAVSLGEPWSDAIAADGAAIAADWARADAKVFSLDLRPTTEVALAQYLQLTNRLTVANYGRLIEFHARSVVDNPALAELLRSVEALEDIAIAATVRAAPASEQETHAAAGARAAAEAVKRYKLQIAAQLAAVDGHELQGAAREMIACEALRDRLAVAKQRHEQHADAELERAADEQRAASRAVAAESARLVRAAEAAAAEAAAAAVRAANDLRLAHADALVARLRARLEAAARTKDRARRIELEHLRSTDTLHDVGSVIANARTTPMDQLVRFNAILDREGQ